MRRILPLCLILSACACLPPAHGPKTTVDGNRLHVVLEYRGRAEALWAVGDFNQWRPGVDAFVRIRPGLWRLDLDLSPGRYAYLLRIEKDDGVQLVADPDSAEDIEDGLGRRLSLLDLSDAMGDIPTGR